MKRIAIYLPESAWSGAICITLEVLKTALAFQLHQGQEPGFSLDLVGIDRNPVTTFGGVCISPELTLDEAKDSYHAIYLPTLWGVDDNQLQHNSPLYPWLRAQHQQGALVFGALTGAYLMAEAGLLDNCIATTHWHFADDFRRRYPRVNLKAEEMLTVQNRLYCGGGVSASLDISIHLIQQFCGPVIAQQCERHCMMGTRRNYRKLAVDMEESKQHKDERVLAIQTWLESHYAEPLSITEITARFGFSQRNLSRRFKAATGSTPQKYLQNYRLEVAKELLTNTDQTIQQICFDTGYESLTVFGRRFRAYTDQSPSEFRHSKYTDQSK